MRKILLTCVVALAVAAPAQAGEGRVKGKELKISGPIVRVSDKAVSVENAVGDAVLTCAVPERLGEKVAAFEAGDKVRMLCVRARGRRAQLVKLERLGDRGKRPEKPAAEKPAVEKQAAAGPIVELGDGSIVVQSPEGRLACRVPEEKQAKLDGLKLGDKVKIVCADGVLAGLERSQPAEKPKPAAGERQLISIARALLADPRILILDEATSNIDRPTEIVIEKAFDRLLAGRTSIIIAHRLATVRRADEILVLEHGRIVQRGSERELMSQDGPFRRLAHQLVEDSLPAA